VIKKIKEISDRVRRRPYINNLKKQKAECELEALKHFSEYKKCLAKLKVFDKKIQEHKRGVPIEKIEPI